MIMKDKLFLCAHHSVCCVDNTSLRQRRLESVEKQKLSIVGLINLAINIFVTM